MGKNKQTITKPVACYWTYGTTKSLIQSAKAILQDIYISVLKYHCKLEPQMICKYPNI